VLAAGSAASTNAAAATFWVSPSGSDRAVGTRTHPFRTLDRAQTAARRDRGASTIRLLGGTYRLDRTLQLRRSDSKTSWVAAAGAHPVLSGAIRVRGWRLHDPARGIWVARVPKGTRSRQLYVNGVRATRARSELYPVGFTRTPNGYEAADDAMSHWRNPRDLELVTLTQWKMMRCPVGAITGREIVMQEPCWTNVNVFPKIWSFQTITWIENAYELLDSPGEWYLDSDAGRVYYIPRRGENIGRTDVELPWIRRLVRLNGLSGLPISHVRFEGLTFAYATWLNNGYASDQSGFHLEGALHGSNLIGHDPAAAATPGNVSVVDARHVIFAHDDFAHLGGVGLWLRAGSQHDTVVGNRFDDISSAAVQLGGVSIRDAHPSSPADVVADNTVSNNLIRHVSREYQDTAAINLGFTTHSVVAHNDIAGTPWAGISVGWGWGLLDPGEFLGLPNATPAMWGTYAEPTTSRRNRILDNRIDGFLEVLWDGGAIYSVGQQGASAADGELIAGNVATGKRRLAGGNVFYTDGGSRYVTLERNVSLGNPPGLTDFGPCFLPDSLAICGLVIPYGSDRGGCRPYGDLTYRGNYWQYPHMFTEACPFPPYPVNVVDDDNHVISGADDVPPAILRNAGLQPRFRSTVGAR
jgi:hypothetical protein